MPERQSLFESHRQRRWFITLELVPALQVKLLRVLQERTYEPLGADRSETTDARVLVATNKGLAEWVRTGLFREDLYYRVNVVRIELPPLRRRFYVLYDIAVEAPPPRKFSRAEWESAHPSPILFDCGSDLEIFIYPCLQQRCCAHPGWLIVAQTLLNDFIVPFPVSDYLLSYQPLYGYCGHWLIFGSELARYVR
jgi:transglutaminase-like putative cysteine protease